MESITYSRAGMCVSAQKNVIDLEKTVWEEGRSAAAACFEIFS